MNAAQWLFLGWLIVVPFATGIIYLACQLVLPLFPKQRKEASERDARMTEHSCRIAAQSVWETNSELSKETRKELVTRQAIKHLNFYRTRVPLPEILDAYVVAAISELPGE